MSGRIAFVALTARGADLAGRMAAELPNSEVHGLATRIDEADETFQDTAAHLRSLFAAGCPIVAVCAAGIVVRALAPLLADKHEVGIPAGNRVKEEAASPFRELKPHLPCN